MENQTKDQLEEAGRMDEEHEMYIREDVVDDTTRDAGKVALAIAILSTILLVVFYFAIRQHVMELSQRVDALHGLQTRVTSLETEVTALKSLPEKTRYMLMGVMTREMAHKAAYLGSQAASREQAAKILKARNLLDEIQKEFAAAAK
ncbi:MAG: hypothetical protein CSA21_01845 [Deltaproteobacteria bacterium]|nr:MAG: hypothetical protein CSA21_01845 [Deltaproteobacteria bacterium]